MTGGLSAVRRHNKALSFHDRYILVLRKQAYHALKAAL